MELLLAAMTAWVAILDRGRVRPGSRVFINGCSGAVGAFAVQLAIAHGARVSGTCGPASKDNARVAGVDPVFAYSDLDLHAQLGKYDVIFDTLGTLEVGHGLSMLGPKGVFVDINPTPSRVLRGLVSRRYKLTFAAMGIKHLPAIAELAGKGTLRPIIGLEAPFKEALTVLSKAEAGHRYPGKIVLTI